MANDDVTADKLFAQTFFTTLKIFNEISQFRELARLGLKHASSQIAEDSLVMAMEMFTSEEYKDVFIDREAALEALGGYAKVGETIATNKITAFQKSVDSGSLVFAHSMLDGAVFDYCRVTALKAPDQWEPIVEDKKFTLAEIRDQSYQGLLWQKINIALKSLERDSLESKLNKLHSICQPPNEFKPVENYVFDIEKIQKYDRDRISIVHDIGPQDSLPQGDEDILYMLNTANYCMVMVNQKFGIKINSEEFVNVMK